MKLRALAIVALTLFVSRVDYLTAVESHPAQRNRIAVTESTHPWKIDECDRLAIRLGLGPRTTRSVYNASAWNHGGWPLWRVTCIYPKKEAKK